jgi:hypothetical protein
MSHKKRTIVGNYVPLLLLLLLLLLYVWQAQQ